MGGRELCLSSKKLVERIRYLVSYTDFCDLLGRDFHERVVEGWMECECKMNMLLVQKLIECSHTTRGFCCPYRVSRFVGQRFIE